MEQKYKYIKHYWISERGKNRTWVTQVHTSWIPRTHPVKEYPGLDVRYWLADSEGVSVCISRVPDDTEIETIVQDGKKVVMELSECTFNELEDGLIEVHELFYQARRKLRREKDHEMSAYLMDEAREKRDAVYKLLWELEDLDYEDDCDDQGE